MRNSWWWLIGAVGIVGIALSFALLIERVTVTGAQHALVSQGWQASFSSPVKKDAFEAGKLYVTDSKGSVVDAKIAIENEGRTVRITGLDSGDYIFHVKGSAVEGKLLKALPVREIAFSVHETIDALTSAEELTSFFKKAKALMSQRQSIIEEISMESSKDDSGGRGGDYSTTNTQVEGVDEGDIVKTDGNYLFTISDHRDVTITDIRDPQQMRKVATIEMTDRVNPNSLYLHDQLLIVLSDQYEEFEESTSSERHIRPLHHLTMVRIYDVSNPEQPKLLREVGTEGYLTGTRMTDGVLYFITSLHPDFWALREIDGAVLRPRVMDSKEAANVSSLPYSDIAILPGATEPIYSIITAVDLATPTESRVETKGYLGGSDQLYMSKEHLYLTTTVYDEIKQSNAQIAVDRMWNPGIGHTEVFKFSLNGTDVVFQQAATLQGTILNQFSMDEYKGYFRVATTEGNVWDETNQAKNHLFIFDQQMNKVGSITDLAPDERIYSARFMGETAYLVTFRETDPLFVIDVSTPTAPKVMGELKIPGFSNYLHPLDENHLIGFGYETIAEKNPNGGEPIIRTKGMKLSLFDVSNMSVPKELATEIIGGEGTYSPIQYDHKALFQNRQRQLFGFPVILYEETVKKHELEYKGSGALIYEISVEKGFSLKGNLVTPKRQDQLYEDWGQQVMRIVYSGDALYAITPTEIRSYTLDTFTPLGNVQIQ